MGTSRHAPALLGIVAMLITLVWIGEFVTDDAMISLRYARNLIDGHGLVWNVGEAPLEGFSNLSHVLLGALALGLGVPPLAGLQVLNIISLFALVALCYAVTLRATESRWLSSFAAVLCGMHAPLAYWGTSGLETASYSLCALAFMASIVYCPKRTGLVVGAYALALLTRPEAPALLIVAAGVTLGLRVLGRTPRVSKEHWRWIILCASITALYFLWRYAYFGHWMPNSAYYKSLIRGKPVLIQQFARQEFWLLFALILVPWWKMRPLPLLLLGLLCAYVVGFWGVKPSVARFHRFLLPVHAPMCILAALGLHYWCVERMWPRARLARAAGWCVAIGLASSQLFEPKTSAKRLRRDRIAMASRTLVRAAVARTLGAHAGAGERVAIGDSGLVAYFTHMTLVDAFGLNNARFIHVHRGNRKAYVKEIMSTEPEWLVITSRSASELVPVYGTGRWMLSPKNFEATYERIAVARSRRQSYHYWIYARRDLGVMPAPPPGPPLDLSGWNALAVDRAAGKNWAGATSQGDPS